MTPTDIAWMAGIIDGEGTVALDRSKNLWSRTPTVLVSSTTRAIVEKCKTACGGNITCKVTYAENHSDSYTWRVAGGAAERLLAECLPFMTEPEKIRRAKMILEERSKVVPRNGKYTPEIAELMFKFEQEFFKNSRKTPKIKKVPVS